MSRGLGAVQRDLLARVKRASEDPRSLGVTARNASERRAANALSKLGLVELTYLLVDGRHSMLIREPGQEGSKR